MSSNRITRILVLFVFVVFVQKGYCQIYTVNEALEIAKTTISDHFPLDKKHLEKRVSTHQSFKAALPFFIVNAGDEGFVLVSKEKTESPVIGFSWTGAFPDERELQDPSIIEFLSTLGYNMNALSSYPNSSFTKQKTTDSQSFPPVSALLATQWNNDSLFCDLFPRNSTANASAVIAMGQVFKYYGRPITGTGEYCYTHALDGEICIEFDKRFFEFEDMDNKIANIQSQTLLYCLAIAAHLQPDGADLQSYVTALPEYYGYSHHMRQVTNAEYDLRPVILNQLSLRKPVPANWKDFSFVIDGYLGLNYFHFNMGKGGLLDGYYDLAFPHVLVDQNHLLLNCYTDFHPTSNLPAPTSVGLTGVDGGVLIHWSLNLPDSLADKLQRIIVLKDGILKLGETTADQIQIDSLTMGSSDDIYLLADYGTTGTSELSIPVRYYTDQTPANIPSTALRNAINTILGYGGDLYRQPTKGELELIDELEIDFVDQRGIEFLTQLTHLRIIGTSMRKFQAGSYLNQLHTLWFLDCRSFDHTVFQETSNLYQFTGRQGIPNDFYDLRHNSEAGSIIMSNHDEMDNQLTDLYRFEKYFPKIAYVDLFHSKEPGMIDSCYISVESWIDFLPNIPHNENVLEHCSPSVMVPCYPDPARNANRTEVTKVSWTSNPQSLGNVFYNVYIGKSRNSLELKGIFLTTTEYAFTFEPNKDYYWKVEAFHNDTTYYSGVFHFSTYEDLQVPFVETFDRYYNNDPIIEDSPFWHTMDQSLTARAVSDRNRRSSGFYGLKMVPQSDAAVTINSPKDSVYVVEFMFYNQSGDLKAEILQNDAAASLATNTTLRLYGQDQGNLSAFGLNQNFTYQGNTWNTVKISIQPDTGNAELSVNDLLITQWNFFTAMSGTINNNPFKGIRFFNQANTGGGNTWIEDFIIRHSQVTGISTLPITQPIMIFSAETGEIVCKGSQQYQLKELTLYDLGGRILMNVNQPEKSNIRVPEEIKNGIYVIYLQLSDGKPFAQKLAIFR